MCYGNFRNKMRFIQRYKSPKFIGIGDKVRYQNNIYDVLVNYIVGETDAHGYTPKVNRTILIIGFFGIFFTLVLLYFVNRAYFDSPLNEDKRG